MKIKNISYVILPLLILSCGGGGSSTYTISGKVQGLRGELVLQNNYKDNITFEKDGTFTFETKLADKEKFNVETLIEPCPQSCSVKNGSGSIDGKNIDNVEINCVVKAWTETKKFLEGTEFENDQITIQDFAMNKKGDVIVLWTISSKAGVYRSEFRNKIWHHPKLNEYIRVGSLPASIGKLAMNDQGDVIIVWHALDEQHKNYIFVSKYISGIWTDPTDLSESFSIGYGNAIIGDVKINNNAYAIILWSQEGGNNTTSLYKSEYRNGAWITPGLASDSLNIQGTTVWSSTLALNDKDEATVVWTSQESTGGSDPTAGIFKSEFRNGYWSKRVTQADRFNVVDGYPRDVQVAMNNSGEAVISWIQLDVDGVSRIYKSDYVNGKWILPNSKDEALNSDEINDYYFFKDMKMDSSGDVILSWTQNNDIRVAERRNGHWTISEKSKIFIDSRYINESMQLAMGDQGDAILSWFTTYQDDEHSSYDYEMTMYKSERRNGKWDWPVSSSNYIVRDWNTSGVSIDMDTHGNTAGYWSIGEQIIGNGTQEQITSKIEYRNNQWLEPDTIFHEPYRGDPPTPMNKINDCRQIVFWEIQSLNYEHSVYFRQYK